MKIIPLTQIQPHAVLDNERNSNFSRVVKIWFADSLIGKVAKCWTRVEPVTEPLTFIASFIIIWNMHRIQRFAIKSTSPTG